MLATEMNPNKKFQLKKCANLLPVILLLLMASPAFARATRIWTEDQLESASALIVIGSVTNIKDLDEINSDLWPGQTKLRGLEATITVAKVLKGGPTNPTIILHYYKWENGYKTSDQASAMSREANGPSLIYLTPINGEKLYLFYLVKDGPSKYAPTSGQLDGAYDSVKDLPNLIWDGFTKETPPNTAKTVSKEKSPDAALTKQIEYVLKDCQNLSHGATRATLANHFTTEGGLYAPEERTYVSRLCPYIKIDVKFILSGTNKSIESPTDTVKSISKPYLEWSIID